MKKIGMSLYLEKFDVFYCSIHKFSRKHLTFEINNARECSFENFMIFRPLIIIFFRFYRFQIIFFLPVSCILGVIMLNWHQIWSKNTFLPLPKMLKGVYLGKNHKNGRSSAVIAFNTKLYWVWSTFG